MAKTSLPSFAALALAGVIATSPSLVAQGDDSLPEGGPSLEEMTVTQLLGGLRKGEVPEAERATAIRLVLKDGEGACRRLYKQLHKELTQRADDLKSDLAKYRRELQKAAVRQVAAKQSSKAMAEVAAAREVIQDLLRDQGLTKERIYSEGDDARGLMERHLQADIEVLLAEDEALRTDRAAIAQGLELYRGRAGELVQVGQVWSGHRSGARGLKKFKPVPLADGIAAGLESSGLDARVRSIPASAGARKVLEGNAEARSELPREEWLGILETNRLRLLTGRSALRVDTRLCAAGRDHSVDMFTLGFFAHQSPVEGKRNPSDRAANFKTSGGAENIARGQRTGTAAVQGWWHSPGHFRNLMGNHGRIGLGGHKAFWTQMFGG